MTTLEIQLKPPVVIKGGADGIKAFVSKLEQEEEALLYSSFFDQYASLAYQIFEDMFEDFGGKLTAHQIKVMYGVSARKLEDWSKLLGNSELRVSNDQCSDLPPRLGDCIGGGQEHSK